MAAPNLLQPSPEELELSRKLRELAGLEEALAGRQFASGGGDGTVRLWRLPEEEKIQRHARSRGSSAAGHGPEWVALRQP